MVRWVRYYSPAYLMLRNAGWVLDGEIFVPPQKITDSPILYVKMVKPSEVHQLRLIQGDKQ